MRTIEFLFILANCAIVTRANYDPSKCPDVIRTGTWETIRMEFVPMGAGINSPNARHLKQVILPAVTKYWSSTLKIRDRSESVQLDRFCRRYHLGVCVEEYPHNMVHPGTCGDVILSDKYLARGDLYDCPVGAVRQEDCVVKRHYTAGNSAFTDGDLFIMLTAEPTRSCTQPGMRLSGYAIGCSRSICGRPTVAAMNLCPGWENRTDEELIDLIIHELAHNLGFDTSSGVYDWIDENGSPQVPQDKQFNLMYEKTESGRIKVLRAITPLHAVGKKIYVRPMPYHIMKSVSARGFGAGSTCDCPMDPKDLFTESQLNRCFVDGGLADCVFVVNSPQVVKHTREYYSCPSVAGMEMENQVGTGSSSGHVRFNCHWKFKNIQGELMNAVGLSRGSPAFISPMTLAFLEDSGWYKVDYAKGVTGLIEGGMFGYHEGCGLLDEKCVADDTGSFLKLTHFPDAFRKMESETLRKSSQCSPDGLMIQTHTDKWTRRTPSEQLRTQYKYNGGSSNTEHTDYCPSMVSELSCASLHAETNGVLVQFDKGMAGLDYSIRCTDVEYDGGDKVRQSINCNNGIVCSDDMQSYQLHVFDRDGKANHLGDCKSRGQKIAINPTTRIICSDARIVCAKRNYPHHPYSNLNQKADFFAKKTKVPMKRKRLHASLHPVGPKPHIPSWDVYTTSKQADSYTVPILAFILIFISV
jgi:hypothetical protein